MSTVATTVVNSHSIESFRWLVENGARFSWLDGQLKISGATWPVSDDVTPRELYRVALKRLNEIELLLLGEACCHCGEALEALNRDVEPVCGICESLGHDCRPEFFRRAVPGGNFHA